MIFKILTTHHFQFYTKTQCLKTTEKVSFNIAIEALYFERTKMVNFGEFLKI